MIVLKIFLVTLLYIDKKKVYMIKNPIFESIEI